MPSRLPISTSAILTQPFPKLSDISNRRGSTFRSCPGNRPRDTQLLLSGRADIGLAQPDPVVIQRVKIKIHARLFLRCVPARHKPLRRQPGFAAFNPCAT